MHQCRLSLQELQLFSKKLQGAIDLMFLLIEGVFDFLKLFNLALKAIIGDILRLVQTLGDPLQGGLVQLLFSVKQVKSLLHNIRSPLFYLLPIRVAVFHFLDHTY
jgi:hypothetical protein